MKIKINMSKVLEYTRKGIWILGVKNIFLEYIL